MASDSDTEAGTTLFLLRFDRGLTRDQAARSAGIAETSLARLERGSRPNPSTARKVADLYGLRPSQIWKARRGPTTKPRAAAQETR